MLLTIQPPRVPTLDQHAAIYTLNVRAQALGGAGAGISLQRPATPGGAWVLRAAVGKCGLTTEGRDLDEVLYGASRWLDRQARTLAA